MYIFWACFYLFTLLAVTTVVASRFFELHILVSVPARNISTHDYDHGISYSSY